MSIISDNMGNISEFVRGFSKFYPPIKKVKLTDTTFFLLSNFKFELRKSS
jgi:hypothetical protein